MTVDAAVGLGGERARPVPWRVNLHAADAGWFLRVWRDGTVSMYPADANRLMRKWQEMVCMVRRSVARNSW